jgi:hypothetical protein
MQILMAMAMAWRWRLRFDGASMAANSIAES